MIDQGAKYPLWENVSRKQEEKIAGNCQKAVPCNFFKGEFWAWCAWSEIRDLETCPYLSGLWNYYRGAAGWAGRVCSSRAMNCRRAGLRLVFCQAAPKERAGSPSRGR